jgi:hypothetical protein
MARHETGTSRIARHLLYTYRPQHAPRSHRVRAARQHKLFVFETVKEGKSSQVKTRRLDYKTSRLYMYFTAPMNPSLTANSHISSQVHMPASCPFNDSEVIAGLARLPALWLRHWQPHSVGVTQERAAYSGLKGWGRTRFLIRNRRLLYAPTPPNGCVLRRTPILAWALLDTLERHPSLPDVSVLFNWCADACMHQRPCLVHDHRLGLSFV